MSTDSNCPCSSGRPFADCCEPILADSSKAETAEALMRARYSAYATGQVEFIQASNAPEGRAQVDLESSRQWSQQAEWTGLEVVATEGGGADDQVGEVEFKAHYAIQGRELTHHELATFRKGDAGEWMFVDGEEMAQEPFRREKPKVGPNEKCPCGSGKKYKKCHGSLG